MSNPFSTGLVHASPLIPISGCVFMPEAEPFFGLPDTSVYPQSHERVDRLLDHFRHNDGDGDNGSGQAEISPYGIRRGFFADCF